MQLPVILELGPFSVNIHPLFEALAYALGLRLYLRGREQSQARAELSTAVVVGAAVGAACGSKVLYWLEWPRDTLAHAADVAWLLGGKSIVGGLLGGWVGVELAKAKLGHTGSTGDRFVLPLAVGMAVGRVGCFLAGLADHTSGVATSLPWGVDFGDGVPRHPTQLYEIGALGLLALATTRLRAQAPGFRFRAFMLGYLAFRLLVDFLKPDPRWVLGLSAIQIACALGILYAVRELIRLGTNTESH